jgi:DNA-binding SARP family transcriptional activator
MPVLWRIELLGGLQVAPEPELVAATRPEAELMGRPPGPRRGAPPGAVTRFRTQKTASLLAYLAYHRDRAHPREELVEQFWPECELERGRNNLSKELSWLRALLEPAGIVPGAVLATDRLSVRLDPECVVTDVMAFEAGLRAAETARDAGARRTALCAALDGCRGRFLTGLHDEWIVREGERLAGRFVRALRPLIALLEAEGDRERALDYAWRGVAIDPLNESSQREVMRLLIALGRPAAAVRQYRELERLLYSEFQAVPESETKALVEAWLARPLAASHAASPLPPVRERRGALPLDAPVYVERPTDEEFHVAVRRGDSLVLVKGARQTGKTSLLARALQAARLAGNRAILTDLQSLNGAHFASPDAFYHALARWMAVQLGLSPRVAWDPDYGPNLNFELFVRQAAARETAPLVWSVDEADRLFTCDFGSDVFGLFRSWHNKRSLEPEGPWSRLTLAIAYATEAHLFISDLNQSPFNVGTRLTLGDFTLAEVAELNRRYGSPLRGDEEAARFHDLLGGQPYLAQRGLAEMASRGMRLGELEAGAERETGIYGDHLRRLLASLSRDAALCDAVRAVLAGRSCSTAESFYRLRTAGVLAGETPSEARPRCRLYAAYLSRHLT